MSTPPSAPCGCERVSNPACANSVSTTASKRRHSISSKTSRDQRSGRAAAAGERTRRSPARRRLRGRLDEAPGADQARGDRARQAIRSPSMPGARVWGPWRQGIRSVSGSGRARIVGSGAARARRAVRAPRDDVHGEALQIDTNAVRPCPRRRRTRPCRLLPRPRRRARRSRADACRASRGSPQAGPNARRAPGRRRARHGRTAKRGRDRRVPARCRRGALACAACPRRPRREARTANRRCAPPARRTPAGAARGDRALARRSAAHAHGEAAPWAAPAPRDRRSARASSPRCVAGKRVLGFVYADVEGPCGRFTVRDRDALAALATDAAAALVRVAAAWARSGVRAQCRAAPSR